MPVGAIIAVVIVFVLVAAAVAFAGTLVLRMAGLRHQFGPEYTRLAREVGVRRAQAELAGRRRRVAELGLRPLTAEQRARYSGEWTAAQERFVDSPSQATETASQLVTAVATDCGYQVGDHAQLVKDLSVHHARRLDGYQRAGRATDRAATAPTEELRQALLSYRALFRDLLAATDGGAPDGGAARPAAPVSAGVPGSTGVPESTGVRGSAGRQSLPAGAPVIRGTVLGRARTGRPSASAAKPAPATNTASTSSKE